MTLIKLEYSNQFIKWLMIFVRTLLVLSISSLVISCLLTLIFGFYNNIVYGIMWFSVMGTSFIYYFSILALIGVAIYNKMKKDIVWKKIKKEIILLGVSIICCLILGLINNYIARP